LFSKIPVMTNVIDMEAIKKLPIDDRRGIIDLIEESIEMECEEEFEDDDTPETEEELQILEERLEHHRNNPEKAISWEDLKKELLGNKK